MWVFLNEMTFALSVRQNPSFPGRARWKLVVRTTCAEIMNF